MGMVSEFKEFIMRGNVMDMAVGVIVGGAFNTIVQSPRKPAHLYSHMETSSRISCSSSLWLSRCSP